MNFRLNIILSALFSTLLVGGAAVQAQEDAVLDESPAAIEPLKNEEMKKKGDVLHLKSGAMMSGVQILKSTPHHYEVELVKGVAPLLIPRNQVDFVEMDDFDPTRDRIRREMFPEAEEVSMASGEKVTRDLMDKLSAPVSTEELSYERKDFVKILNEIAKDVGVKLQIDESVQSMQPNRRRWTFKTTPEKTLISLLQDDLVGKFNYIVVKFNDDTISIMTKQAAKKLEASSAGEEN